MVLMNAHASENEQSGRSSDCEIATKRSKTKGEHAQGKINLNGRGIPLIN